MIKFGLLLYILLLASICNAAFSFGTGLNSSTGGRTIPSFNVGFGSDSVEYQIMSTGVSTSTYYHSTYSLGIYRAWKAGDILGGGITAGFGGGFLYGVRGLKQTGSTLVSQSDYVVGPSFFGRWNFLSSLFVSVECIYGVVGPSSRSGDLIALNARDHVNLSFGVRL